MIGRNIEPAAPEPLLGPLPQEDFRPLQRANEPKAAAAPRFDLVGAGRTGPPEDVGMEAARERLAFASLAETGNGSAADSEG